LTDISDASGQAGPDSLLQGETIIYFGPERWEGMWRNRHQLMSRLARRNRVIYVEPPQNLRPLLRSLSGFRFTPSSEHEARMTEHESGVVVYHSPWWTPLTGRRRFRNLSLRVYFEFLARGCSIEKSCQPIIWLSRPQMSDYVGKLGEKLSIYHVVDEYTAYAGVDARARDWVIKHEQSVAQQVDAVIVVTPALLKSKSLYNPHTYLVPNAVNYAAYANASAEAPPDMAEMLRPIIGFTGLVSARLDLGLILDAAQARPEWSFVFVGSIDDTECARALQRLDELDNVHFLGVRPVESMPAYLQRFDICTIPYAADDNAANASPLKLYEYAAVGKPIVTSDFAAAREFSGHLQRVSNATEFLRACELALRMSPADPQLLENQQFAADNTWENRVDTVSEIIKERLSTNRRQVMN